MMLAGIAALFLCLALCESRGQVSVGRAEPSFLLRGWGLPGPGRAAVARAPSHPGTASRADWCCSVPRQKASVERDGAAGPCPSRPSPSSSTEPCSALCWPAAGTFQPGHGPASCASPVLPALAYPLPTSLTAAELRRSHAGRTACARHSLEHGASSSCTVRERFLSLSIGKRETSGLSTACCQRCLRSL